MASVEFIQRAVAHHFGISLLELQSKRRDVTFSHPRMIAMYMCRVHLKMTYQKIGIAFNRHHTDAIYAFKRVIIIIDTNEQFIDEHLDPISNNIRKVMSYA